MRRLTSSNGAERDSIIARIEEAKRRLDDAVENYNAHAELLKNELEAAIDELNGEIEKLCSWKDAIIESVDEFWSERPITWQEGEKGVQYESWKQKFEDVDFPEVEVDGLSDIRELEVPVDDILAVIEAARGLPESPGG